MVFKCRRELVEKDFDPKMLANQCDKNEFLKRDVEPKPELSYNRLPHLANHNKRK